LCLLDTRPRSLDGTNLERLHDLADIVLQEFRGIKAVSPIVGANRSQNRSFRVQDF
jgi:hypothetical protein